MKGTSLAGSRAVLGNKMKSLKFLTSVVEQAFNTPNQPSDPTCFSNLILGDKSCVPFVFDAGDTILGPSSPEGLLQEQLGIALELPWSKGFLAPLLCDLRQLT